MPLVRFIKNITSTESGRVSPYTEFSYNLQAIYVISRKQCMKFKCPGSKTTHSADTSLSPSTYTAAQHSSSSSSAAATASWNVSRLGGSSPSRIFPLPFLRRRRRRRRAHPALLLLSPLVEALIFSLYCRHESGHRQRRHRPRAARERLALQPRLH